MRIYLQDRHKEHIRRLGHEPQEHIDCEQHQYFQARALWQETLARTHARVDEALLEEKVIGHLVSAAQSKQKQAELSSQIVIHKHVHRLPWWMILLFLLLALALTVPRAHCQFSHINTITFQHADGTQNSFYSGPFAVREGTNVTFSSGSCPGANCGLTFINASSTASTAWSAITAGTNSNAGTFAMSGNTLDLTAATLVKLRTAAGLTTSANGDLGYDSTSNTWRIWQNAADQYVVASTNKPSADCVPIGNSDGTTTCGDPLVQGTQAAGSTTMPNPVVIGGSDYGGTPAVRVMKVDSSGQLYFGNFPANFGISGTPTVEPGNTANTTPWLFNLNDGTHSLTAAISAYGTAPTGTEVQGVNAFITNTPTVTANAGTGNFTVIQPTGTNLHIVCDSGCSSSTAPADESAFTEGTTSFSPVGGYFQTSPTSLTTAHMGAVGMTATRHLFVNIPDALPAGTNIVGKVGIDQSTPGTTNAVQATNFPATVDTNTGNASASTPRVVIATNQPNLTTPLNVQCTAAANCNNASVGATGSAVPASATYTAGIGSGATGGNLVGVAVGDTYKPVNISTATTTLLITGVAARQVHITALHLVVAGTDNVALIEGTGATCGTGTAGMAGGTTAASGYNFAANGGMTHGTGQGTVIQTQTAGDSVCAVTSAAVQLSGGIEYTIY